MVIEQIKFIIEREEKKQTTNSCHTHLPQNTHSLIYIYINIVDVVVVTIFFFIDSDIFPFLNSNEIKNTTHFIWSCQLKRNRKCHKFHVFPCFDI